MLDNVSSLTERARAALLRAMTCSTTLTTGLGTEAGTEEREGERGEGGRERERRGGKET